MSLARDTRETGHANPRPLLAVTMVAAAFALAAGAVLGIVGLSTSGFSLTLTAGEIYPVVAVLFTLHVAVGLAVLLGRLLLSRGSGRWRGIERRLIHAGATVALWAILVVTFLPLKGSEAFVRAGTLTTFQLNLIGLATVLVVGWVAGWLVSFVVAAFLNALRRRLSTGRLRAAALVAAAAAIVAVGAGSAARGRGLSTLEGAGRRDAIPRVAVIGVDGCDWEKLGPLVEAGRLPTFERLMERGSYGPLLSIEPLVSPRIWTSIATGKVAEKHGIQGFVNDRDVPVNATMWTAAPVWDIVSGHGAPVGVVGWYVTWPVEARNGFVISDRVHSLLRGPIQAAQSLTGRPTNDRLEAFGGFEFDPAYKRYPKTEKRYLQNRIVDEPLRWGYLRDLVYSEIAYRLCPAYRPVFTAVYFRGVDFVQHFFWKYADPEPFGGVTAEDEARYGTVIASYYEYQDALLERLLEVLGDDVSVILVSDHGFQARLDPDPNRPELTGMHDLRGVFIASGPAFRANGYYEGATILDVAPTALAVMGLPVAEDMDGRVLEDVIRPEHLDARPVGTVASYEPALGRERGEVGSAMDDSIKEQLRSLGYIE
jgi:predicted AlkP superfamily phosphohydrolase/phosphomutase